MLAPTAATATGALLAAIAVSFANSGPTAAKYTVWLLAVFLILRFLVSVCNWAASFVVITEHRFLLISGLFKRKIVVSKLDDLKILATERSTAGSIIGYGAFRVGPDGPSQLVIDYIPYPEQLYHELGNMLYYEERE